MLNIFKQMQKNQLAAHSKLLQLYPLPYSGHNNFLFLLLVNWWDATSWTSWKVRGTEKG